MPEPNEITPEQLLTVSDIDRISAKGASRGEFDQLIDTARAYQAVTLYLATAQKRIAELEAKVSGQDRLLDLWPTSMLGAVEDRDKLKHENRHLRIVIADACQAMALPLESVDSSGASEFAMTIAEGVAARGRVSELEARFAALTAPVRVKCPACNGEGSIADPWPESETGWGCSLCNGAKQILDPRLQEIRKRVEAATPGPCYIEARTNPYAYVVMAGDRNEQGPLIEIAEYSTRNKRNRGDAEFDAHSRVDIPYLLDRLGALMRPGDR